MTEDRKATRSAGSRGDLRAPDEADPSLLRQDRTLGNAASAPTRGIQLRRWPVILVVSRKFGFYRHLLRQLRDAAQVESVGNLYELANALDEAKKRLPIIVLDCVSLRLSPDDIATHLGGLPPSATLLLRGVQGGAPTAGALARRLGVECIACSVEATAEDLAILIKPFLTQP